MMPACASVRPRWEVSSGDRPGGSSAGPGRVSIGEACGAQLCGHRGQALDADLVVGGAEDRYVAFVPAGWHQHLGGVAGDVAQDSGDRLGHPDRVFAVEVGQQLDAEANVALLVCGDVLDPLAERGQRVALL